MSTDRAAEIRARADAATPGPWEAKQNARRGNTTVLLNPDGQFVAHYVNPTDAEFLAAARQDIPHLLDLVDEYRKREQSQDRVREQLTHERDELRAQVERMDRLGERAIRAEAAACREAEDERDAARAAIGERRTSQDPAATVPVWALERAIDGGEG